MGPTVKPIAALGTDLPCDQTVSTTRYRNYVLWLLFTVYVFNFVDRQILTILIQPIKEEFKFSDTQLGLLGGLAFAVLYSTLGVPIARWADRGDRVSIISLSLLVWSVFTALTGLAGRFSHFLFARMAVGVGEAGCSPAAYSILSDYFERERRTTALSIYSMGIYGGVFVGFLVGGYVAQAYGWRSSFYVVGLPGVLLAAIVKLTLREPRRATGMIRTNIASPAFLEVLAALWAKPAFRHTSLAAALHSFVGYGVSGFYPAFLIRSHAMSVAEVGRWLALVVAFSGILGTYLGGRLADRYSNDRGDARYQLWVPGISTLLSIPVSLLIYFAGDRQTALIAMFAAGVFGAMYLGPTFAITQSLTAPAVRAIAAAIMLLIINLIGLGLGPLLAGALSDWFHGKLLANGLTDAAASGEGLKWSLATMTLVNVWSGVHYMLAARSVRQDAVS